MSNGTFDILGDDAFLKKQHNESAISYITSHPHELEGCIKLNLSMIHSRIDIDSFNNAKKFHTTISQVMSLLNLNEALIRSVPVARPVINIRSFELGNGASSVLPWRLYALLCGIRSVAESMKDSSLLASAIIDILSHYEHYVCNTVSITIPPKIAECYSHEHRSRNVCPRCFVDDLLSWGVELAREPKSIVPPVLSMMIRWSRSWSLRWQNTFFATTCSYAISTYLYAATQELTEEEVHDALDNWNKRKSATFQRTWDIMKCSVLVVSGFEIHSLSRLVNLLREELVRFSECLLRDLMDRERLHWLCACDFLVSLLTHSSSVVVSEETVIVTISMLLEQSITLKCRGGLLCLNTTAMLKILINLIGYVIIHRFSVPSKCATLVRSPMWSTMCTYLAELCSNSTFVLNNMHPTIILFLFFFILPYTNFVTVAGDVFFSIRDGLLQKSLSSLVTCDPQQFFHHLDLVSLLEQLGPLEGSDWSTRYMLVRWPPALEHRKVGGLVASLVPNFHSMDEDTLRKLLRDIGLRRSGLPTNELRSLVPSKEINAMCRKSAIAHRVFESVDLCLCIASFLSFKRVCRVACVCTSFAQAVRDGAEQLWRQLYLQRFDNVTFALLKGASSSQICEQCWNIGKVKSATLDSSVVFTVPKKLCSRRLLKPHRIDACQCSIDARHDWCSLFKVKALVVSRVRVRRSCKEKNAITDMICSRLGCCVVFRSQEHRRTHAKKH